MPKGNHRTNGRTDTDPDTAFLAYAALGGKRSLKRLFEMFEAAETKVSLRTLTGWSKRDHWVGRAIMFDRQRAKAQQLALIDESVDMDIRQAALGRTLQLVGGDQLKRLQDADTPLEPRDVLGFIKTGQFVERLAVGEATSKDGVVEYNTIVLPILNLFQQVVGTMPEEIRGVVTRQFADGVNAIRDSVVVINEDGEAVGDE